MSPRRRAEAINAWWEGRPAERYWLDVTRHEDRDRFLAAPRGEGADAAHWIHRLITHVRSGDLVFHYDAERSGITAVSVARGRVEKKPVSWPARAGDADEPCVTLPSWRIGLRQPSLLAAFVPRSEIAAIQWDLFPALRALEDEVGDPLYYPFEMDDREDTRPVAGYVLKLPAVLVGAIPRLAGAARRNPSHELVERDALPATSRERMPAAGTATARPLRRIPS